MLIETREAACLDRHDEQGTKKAGRLPMPAYVGSSKNLLPERQRNAQQDRRHSASCWCISIQWQKGDLGRTWRVHICFC